MKITKKNSLGKSVAVSSKPSTAPKPRQMYVPKIRSDPDNKGKEVVNANDESPSADVLKLAVPFQEGTIKVIDIGKEIPMVNGEEFPMVNRMNKKDLEPDHERVEDIPQSIFYPLAERMSR